MGLTLLCVTETMDDGSIARRLLISNEYSVHKDNGEKEWQHPDSESLRYTEFGNLALDERLSGLMHTLLYFGTETFGGHIRFIEDGAAGIASGREQTWTRKSTEDKEYYERLKAEEYERHCAQMKLEHEKRAPMYEFCTRCQEQREACKNPEHRGRRCMSCCGGLGDASNRHCSNCLDLPYRQQREKALGDEIVYAGE
jgi:hypothetical protein